MREHGAPVTLSRFLAVVVVVGAIGCAPAGGEGPGHRAQRLALSPQQEYELGTRAYTEVLKEARQQRALVTSGPAVERGSGPSAGQSPAWRPATRA